MRVSVVEVNRELLASLVNLPGVAHVFMHFLEEQSGLLGPTVLRAPPLKSLDLLLQVTGLLHLLRQGLVGRQHTGQVDAVGGVLKRPVVLEIVLRVEHIRRFHGRLLEQLPSVVKLGLQAQQRPID